MNRLVNAGIFRLKKNKVYLGALIVILLFTSFFYAIQYYRVTQINVECSFDPLIFNFLIIIGVVTAVFVPLFIGTEYNDGTIRNKLIIGFSRFDVYLANLITCILGEIVIVIVNYIVGVILGVSLFGNMEMTITNLILLFINGIFISLAYTSIFYMITMICSSKATSAVICILLAFGMFFISISLFSRLSEPQFINQTLNQNSEVIKELVINPKYLSGTIRDVCESILYLLPSGQIMSMINKPSDNNFIMMLYSSFIIIITSTIGFTVFSKKDIK